MLIDINTYYILIVILAAVIVVVPLALRFIARTGIKFDFLYVFLLVLLPLNWFTPAVYTVSKCGEYRKEVVVLPTMRDGQQFSLGWHNYFINQSSATLTLEDVAYGNVDQTGLLPTVKIAPGATHQAPFVSLDYAFEEPADSARSKSGGAIKHLLSCR